MSDKNLLVITNNFPNSDGTYVGEIFVKEQLHYLKKYFTTIYVISPVAYGIERHRKTRYENYVFDNVKVYFPKYLNFPIFYDYGRFGWVFLAKNAIFDVIQKENITFDLIHAHFTWPSGVLAGECKKKYHVPLVITEHTSDSFRRAIDNRNYYSVKTWELADAIIRVKGGDIADFGKVGISLQKVRFIPNGFDAQKFYPAGIEECRKKLGLPKEKKIILYVGNFYSEVKGHKYLVESLTEIIQQRNDILVIIVGSGTFKSDVEKQICTLGLGEYMRTVGNKPHTEIPLWMNACDIFVLPSLNECNPTVMFEALGCGKPFVGTKVGGVPEIIISDAYGLLVRPADPKDLAEKILIALDRKWDREAILTYAKQFTWENVAKEIMDVYEQVLG